MSWGKIDDRLPEHPKWMELERKVSPRVWANALATWVVVLCYANRNETDGEIESTLLARISPIGRDALAAADALVDVRLMEKTEHGYRLHDFTEYNPSKAKKVADRKADANRKSGPKPLKAPNGIRTESERTTSGFQEPANRIPDTPARPGPTPPHGDLKRAADLDQVAREPSAASPFHERLEWTSATFRAAFEATGEKPSPWMLGFGTADWTDLTKWIFSTHALDARATLEALAQGFARSAFAKKRGHRFRGQGGLIDAPGEFLALGPAHPRLGGGESEAEALADLRKASSK